MDVTMTAAELQGPPVGVCAKTGGRADTSKPFVVRYTPPWVFLLIVFLGIGLIFILIALALSTKVRTAIPLSRAAARDVARRRLVGTGVLVGGTILSFVIVAQLNFWVGFTGVFVSFVYGLYLLCLPAVRAKMSADGTVLLKGVSPVWVHAMRSRPMYVGYAPMPYANPGRPVGQMPVYAPYATVQGYGGQQPAVVPYSGGLTQGQAPSPFGAYGGQQPTPYGPPPEGMPPYAPPPPYVPPPS